MEVISHSKEETWEFASEYANELKAGDVLALYGDLGSGKTTFTQGLAQALGVDEPVTSPTFVIMKNYSAKVQGDEVKLNHVDCYRISESDVEAIGLDEIFLNQDSVTVLEWPSNIESILPERTKKLYFEYINEDERRIKLK